MILAKAWPGIRFNKHMEGDGETVFRHACKLGLEGIVSKSRARLQRRAGKSSGKVDYHLIRLFSRCSRDPASPSPQGGFSCRVMALLQHSKRKRAALSRPVAWAKSLRHSIAPSHSAHASIVALDRDGPTATEPSSLVRVVVAVASVIPLTVCRSPGIDPDATRSYVHTLSQTWRWHCHRHCANESQCNQCSRDQHGLSSFFPVLCRVTNEGRSALVPMEHRRSRPRSIPIAPCKPNAIRAVQSTILLNIAPFLQTMALSSE
jgi:hypothetical protein